MVKKALFGFLVVATVCGCQQKAEQQTPGTAQTAKEPAPSPRPAGRQSDARIWVDAVTGKPGDKGSFGVHYYGVEQAKAIVVPISYPQGMIVDSISWAGSMLAYLSTRPTRIDKNEHRLLLSAIPTTEPLIPAAEGLLATIHFTLGPDAQSGIIADAFVPPANYLVYVDSASGQAEPIFETATVTIERAP